MQKLGGSVNSDFDEFNPTRLSPGQVAAHFANGTMILA
jgi:hypothetical protein